MAIQKPRAKKKVLSRKRAVVAAKKAQRHYKMLASRKTDAWEKGGSQWSRVLGHFGQWTERS